MYPDVTCVRADYTVRSPYCGNGRPMLTCCGIFQQENPETNRHHTVAVIAVIALSSDAVAAEPDEIRSTLNAMQSIALAIYNTNLALGQESAQDQAQKRPERTLLDISAQIRFLTGGMGWKADYVTELSFKDNSIDIYNCRRQN